MKDQLNRILEFKKTPKRIISLVPSLTELICDLGLESSLVGVTKFCVHPKSLLKDKAIVGGTKQVHYNIIRDLNPDIILCNKEENTQDMVQCLGKIAPVHISDINTIDDCLEIIEMYGTIFQVEKLAERIRSKIQKEQRRFELFVENQPNLTVAYFIWKNPWMVAGSNTFIDYILRLNNFKNVYEDKSRYPEIDIEKKHPEVECVMLSSEPFPFKEEHFKLLQPQFPNAKIILVDGEMFSWYGSRLLKAFQYFKKLHLERLN